MTPGTTPHPCSHIEVRGPLTWFRALTEVESQAFVISLAGDADYGNLRDQPIDGLLVRYRESGCQRLVIDVSQVTVLDSTGISWLLRFWDAAETQGATPTLRAAPLRLQRLLRANGIAGLFAYELA